MLKNKLFLLTLLVSLTAFSQNPKNRIRFHDQDIFVNGANVAWVHFANDIGPNAQTDIERFRKIFADVHANGGNVMRLWLHTTGAFSPAFDDKGFVTGPGEKTIDDLKNILDVALENHVTLDLCLWSFDMLRQKNGEKIIRNSKNILSNPEGTKSYINNSLIPMVQALKGHPGIFCWEIFNEPEGMSNEFGWKFNEHVPMANIQRFVNQCAGAIHRTDPSVLVTNGSWSFFASYENPPKYKNYYTDAKLIAAGGDKDGTLDFYSVHYYDWAGEVQSPFHHDAAEWQLDKPLVMAEFAPKTTFGVDAMHLYEELYKRGYAGGMAWSWTDAHPENMLEMMKAVFEGHQADVELKTK